MTAITASAPVRLTRLHLASRRVPAALAALVFAGVALRVLLRWTPASGLYSVMFPLIVATAAASVVAVCAHGPFGEPERATGPRLARLRLGTTLVLSCAACGVLAAGAIGGRLAMGDAALLRDTAGLIGVALATAVVADANQSWIGALAYLLLSVYAVAEQWMTPWLWAARPSGDRGGAICAGLVFAAGAAAVAIRGARE